MTVSSVDELDPWELHKRAAQAAFSGELGAELVILRCRTRKGRCANDLAIVRSTGLGPLFIAYTWPTKPGSDPEARQHEIDWNSDTAPSPWWVRWTYTRSIPPPTGSTLSEFDAFGGEVKPRLDLLTFERPPGRASRIPPTVCRRHGASTLDREQLIRAADRAKRSGRPQVLWITPPEPPAR